MQDIHHPLSVHPRRAPAHLSVSLKHSKSPPTSGSSGSAHDGSQSTPLSERPSNQSTTESTNAQKWFENSNKMPMDGIMHSDPPFYLKRSTSSLSDSILPDRASLHRSHPRFELHHGTNSNSNDDFRSVIDDLTIKNKKLKERLRKYETSYDSHLDAEKLFEVKVHGLPPHKRRELEETLRSFVSGVNGTRVSSPDERPLLRGKPSQGNGAVLRSHPSSSTSNSRLVDSAYASMSSIGPTSSSRRDRVSFGRKHGEPSSKTQDQKVESFLHDIPEGLLPKHYPALSDKGKKRIVVRRLEQLFTGKGRPVTGSHSQPLQQQEISRSAAKADREAVEGFGSFVVSEGHREALILTAKENEVPGSTLCAVEHTDDSGSASPEVETRAPEQRPTRPLDLDPERAQNPKDNLDYIRHLGLDSPMRADASEGVMDSEGWIYLNLLVSMAQLHTINVTPDFIRAAVTEVSQHFEVSRDGRKLRWKGGTTGTALSSDSGAESGLHSSPNDSDSLDDIRNSRLHGKDGLSANSHFGASFGRSQFQPKPLAHPGNASYDSNGRARLYGYTPLFRHLQSSSEAETSTSEVEQYVTSTLVGQSRTGAMSIAPTQRAARKAMKEGSLVFYSGASFVVDLSSDHQANPSPYHDSYVGKDGYSNRTDRILGCKPDSTATASLYRSDSGSQLNSRPFKDYSIIGDRLLQPSHKRPRTPDLMTSSDEEEDGLLFRTEWSNSESRASSIPQDLEYSGLGGTRPSDHFHITVDTTRTKLDSKSRARLSKFSAPSAKRRKFMHNVSPSSLAAFRGSTRSAEAIKSRLASLRADSPPTLDVNVEFNLDPPVKINFKTVSIKELEPSQLPPPAMWYNRFSSDDSYYDGDSTDSNAEEIAMLRERSQQPIQMTRETSNESDQSMPVSKDGAMISGGDADSDGVSISDDESIDMLAPARAIDPEAVAAQEAEFESETRTKMNAELPLGSSAATVDGGSAFEISAGSDYQGEMGDDSMSSDEHE